MDAKRFGWGLLLLTGAMVGCGDRAGTNPPATNQTPPADTSKKKDAPHTHGSGPNGGVVFDLGKYHAEFTVDHPAKECTVLFLAGDSQDAQPLPVAATELTLNTKQSKVKEGSDLGKVVPPMTITLKPVSPQNGKAAKFVGTDSGIGNVADFEGTVLGEIDGKPSQGTFKE
jgi:hypothetical protein